MLSSGAGMGSDFCLDMAKSKGMVIRKNNAGRAVGIAADMASSSWCLLYIVVCTSP